jgi:NADH:ubiquinone oxidoreductase subunit 2 (subunit N)
MRRRGRRVAWKLRRIGGIEVGRAFSVLLVTAVTGMYVMATGERLVGALVILASSALFAAVWVGYRKQH